MKISYSINSDEFLEYQMFSAFRSKTIQQKQVRGRLLMTFITGGLGVFLMVQKEWGLGIYFAVLAVLIFFFHQRYFNFRLKRQYARFIAARLKDKLGANCDLYLEDKKITVKDALETNTHNPKDIVEVSETPLLLLIKFTTGTILFFPKKQVEDRAAFDAKINFYEAPYQSFLSWKY